MFLSSENGAGARGWLSSLVAKRPEISRSKSTYVPGQKMKKAVFSEGGVAGYFNRNMIFPNFSTKTKGTFVKQYRKLVQPTARLFVEKLGRPPKSPDLRFLGTRGGPVREVSGAP